MNHGQRNVACCDRMKTLLPVFSYQNHITLTATLLASFNQTTIVNCLFNCGISQSPGRSMARNKVSCLVTSWNLIMVLCCLSCTGTSQEDYTQCGMKTVSRAKLVKGSRSYPGQWPWQVSIHKTKNTDGSGTKKFHCGGTLIDSRWVLTAAHCFYDDKNPKRYTIKAGDHNIWLTDSIEQERLITEIIIFPNYRHFPYYESDLALAKLTHNVVLTPYVRTVCLPEASGIRLSTAGSVVHVAGWGRISERGNFSSILLHSNYRIQNNDFCRRATRHFFNETVTFCAGDGRGISDTCSGDSGGSLVRQVLYKGGKRWVTVGLVSWGEGCARVGKYGYNTRLEPFIDWILKTIVECHDTGSPQHGVHTPTKRKYRYKDKVFFTCETNYTRIGASSIICRDDGTWSGHQAVCLAPCRDPGIPREGWRLDHDFTHGKTVRFRCKKGGQLPSKLLMTCTNGRWDSDIPKCIVECPDPGNPRNGARMPQRNNYVYKDEVFFKCKTNYTQIGPSSIICQKGGTWNGHQPICLAPCKDPGIPEGGIRLDHDFNHGQAVRFICNKAHQEQAISFITCINGEWDRSFGPNCADCGLPLGMENKTIPDGSIRASSSRDKYHTGKEGRLNGPRAWCSGKDTRPYLEIDFGRKLYKITCLATQGSALDSKWVVAYTLTYSVGGSSFFTYKENNIEKIFKGNDDTKSIVLKQLRKPFVAYKMRFLPLVVSGSESYPACMRVEVYGNISTLADDCIMVGSRLVAKWASYYIDVEKRYIYYTAYLTSISRRYWKVELENENHGRPAQKYLQKYTDLPFVLDVPPKHEELQVGTRVLAPWSYRYYSGTIKTGRDRYNRYRVRADDGDEKDFTVDQIRLLKAPTFCD